MGENTRRYAVTGMTCAHDRGRRDGGVQRVRGDELPALRAFRPAGARGADAQAV